MSEAVRNALERRFLSGELSDCDVVFCVEPEHACCAALTEPYTLCTQADGRVLVGAPLPAHLRILCDGSELFPAALERWRADAADAGGEGEGGSDGGTTEARPAKRQRVTAAAAGAAGGPERPQFTVGLWAPGERRLAEALLRFMYCGGLRLHSMADLLRARPVALRLAVEGGVQACDGGVRAALAAAKAAGSEAAHAAVLDVYHCRAVLPEPADAAGADPTGPALLQDVLAFCREALAAHCNHVYPDAATPDAAAAAAAAGAAAGEAAAAAPAAAGGAGVAPPAAAVAAAGVVVPVAAVPGATMGEQPGGGSGPPLGELLAFAFESVEAVFAAHSTYNHLRSLPPQAMEALLASESFATDDEASVLLLVAVWRGADRRCDTPAGQAAVQRLLRNIRWPHVNDAFLLLCAPLVPWLGMSLQRAAWLSVYGRAATPEQRAAMERAAAAAEHSHFQLDAPGHRAPRRPAAGTMTVNLQVQVLVCVQTTVPLSRYVFLARGFTWHVCVVRRGEKLGVALACLKDVYGIPQSTPMGVAFPGQDVVLSVLGADGEVAHSVPCGSANGGEGIRVGSAGTPLLLDWEDRAAEGEARWARYLRAGELHFRVEVRS
ncbi:hypothetical protein HXX76_015148 [Chlamydomonas incerta]|uniref:BACK domain-containing protein n=1 Tax=Chlamydomonas incerta TaxID=51695 RepID=A0A835SDP1_CHLIN|nr:hypothetical protein HXX76_015148 [Chlamydomonas incerta]|eukprot:KAG2423631.1 hypothetical protein HXX76_015148 [Chlamydomonas incerta]